MSWAEEFGPRRDADGALHGGRLVIFDGACGFCTWTVRWLRRWDVRRGLTFVPYQALEPRDFERFGTSRERCAREVQYVDHRDRAHGGAAAINRILWSLPGGRAVIVLAALGTLPAAFALESAAYRFVARNRVAISALLGTAKYALIDPDDPHEPPSADSSGG